LVSGAMEAVTADVAYLDDTLKAVSGSSVAFLVVGLKYDLKVWRELWPRIMDNAIEACKRSNSKLVFFDNVYMYGKVDGVMTEETPFRPCSKKGEIRAEIATMLLNEIKAGKLTALIARSADFYKGVFGWNIRKRGDGSTAFDDTTGQVSGTWVLGRPPSGKPGLLFYIMVDSVAATVDAVVAHGGEIVQPIGGDAPEITARFCDPGGNVIGLYQQPA